MKGAICIGAFSLALAASAAIVTFRNDLFIYPPNYATFVGTGAQPGIGLSWIPYGTYTYGSGGMEYTRITSNLIGVVASAFDGAFERQYMPLEYFMAPDAAFYYPVEFKQTMLPCYTNFPSFSDNGQFLQSITNNTARILDNLNASTFVTVYHEEGSPSYYYFENWWGEIEHNLAREEYYDEECWHDGLAQQYAGDALEALCIAAGLSTEPPIPDSWTNRLPFLAADSNLWVNVWPIYAALTNDIHFFPAITNLQPRYYRWHLDNYYAPNSYPRFFEPVHLVEIWGSDVVGGDTSGTARTLEAALESMPMDFTMENVLSYNTGWKYEVPPVCTSDTWTVSGPLGTFRLYEYKPPFWGEKDWWAIIGLDDDMFVMYTAGSWCLHAQGLDEDYNPVTYVDVTVPGGEDAEDLDFGEYAAHRTRLYADTDDYAHWRNGTSRLDWKRLGIICQLESQMSRTYLARDDEDELPLLQNDARHTYTYELSEILNVATESGVPKAETMFYPPSSAWALTGDETVCTTNLVGWSYPTAQLHGVGESGKVEGSTDTVGPELWVTESKFSDVFDPIAQGLVNTHGLGDGTFIIELSGYLAAQGNSGLLWDWGVDWADFFPTSGNSEQFYPTNSATSFFAPFLYPTNVAVDLTMYLHKYASTKYTVAKESMYTNFAARLSPYPLPQVWETNYVKRQRRPTLEVMLDLRGLENLTPITNEVPLAWVSNADPKSTRQFRMDQQIGLGAWATSRQSSDRIRWRITGDLNGSVVGRFQELTRITIDEAAWHFMDFPPSEEAALKAQLLTSPLFLFTSLDPVVIAPRLALVVVGIMPVANGVVGNCTIADAFFAWLDEQGESHTQAVVEESGSYHLGTYHYTVRGSELPYTVSTNEPVRVDGHQDQMISTEWLPRNLRFVGN